MRTDILDLHKFYESDLGRKVAQLVSGKLLEAWGEASSLRLGGFGFAGPFLEAFPKAERRLSFSPAAQGVIRWPQFSAGAQPNCASLIQETRWPLPDASLDRIFIVHGFEEATDPHRLAREVWRVLAPEGRLIVAASHRRGLWSTLDVSPFAAGRPYSKRQLITLLEDATFDVGRSTGALYFPPIQSKFLLRAADSWERAGAHAWSGLSGVLMVEATKSLVVPAGKKVADGIRIQRRGGVRPATVPRQVSCDKI